MKCIFALSFVIVVSPLWVSAQGTVNFSAGAPVSTRIATNSEIGGPSTGLISGGIGSYYFGLFVAPVTVTSVPSGPAPYDPTLYGFTFTGDIGTNTGNLGRFSGNPGTDFAIVPGYAPGHSANFTVVGWSSNVGDTWEEA